MCSSLWLVFLFTSRMRHRSNFLLWRGAQRNGPWLLKGRHPNGGRGAPSGWVGLTGHTISSALGSHAGSSALVTSLGHGTVPGVRCHPLIPFPGLLSMTVRNWLLCVTPWDGGGTAGSWVMHDWHLPLTLLPFFPGPEQPQPIRHWGCTDWTVLFCYPRSCQRLGQRHHDTGEFVSVQFETHGCLENRG